MTDLRYSLRTLANRPGFVLTAVLSLALGVGANTAIFTLLDQLVLRLLPVRHPEQLVQFHRRGSHYGSNTGMNSLSYPMYKDIRERNQVFTDVFCRHRFAFSIGYGGRTERGDGEFVSGNYFEVLGAGAAIGRVITADDDRIPGGHPVAVLSYDFWADRFASDPHILGQKLIVNGMPLTVIGVSARGFDGVEVGVSPKVRVPVMMRRQLTPGMWAEIYNLENRRAQWVNVFARLKPGVTAQQAQASLAPLFHSILEDEARQKDFAHATEYDKQEFLRSTLEVLPGARGRSYLRRQFSSPLWILMAIVGFVLLIACANVANLMMARAAGRQKEIAVRLALGAGRRRILRQLLVESLLLAVLGGGAGVLIASWLDVLLVRFVPYHDTVVPLSTDPDLRILAFTLAISAVTALLFGVAPAIQSMRVDVGPVLKEQSAAVLGGGSARLRKAMVVAQVFLSLLLLIGAGMFIRSLRNLKLLNPGYRTDRVIAFSVDPTLNAYNKERSFQFYRQLRERLSGIPGVDSAGLALVRFLDDNEWDNSVTIEGHERKPGERTDAFFNAVSPGFFRMLGVPLLAGREFTPADEDPKHKVAVVNEKFARKYCGSIAAAVGRHYGYGLDPSTKTDVEIIGVIPDIKYETLREDIPPQTFVPYAQMDSAFEMTAYVRTRLEPEDSFRAVRSAVHEPSRLRDAYVRRADRPFAVHGPDDRDAFHRIRPAGDVPRRRRPVRRAGVHRGAPHARDRYPCGAGRRPAPHRVAGAGRRRSYGGGRRRARASRGLGAVAAGEEPALRDGGE